MRKASTILAGILSALPFALRAYEIDTHAFITSHAHDRSALKDPALLRRMGIDRFGSDNENPPFGVIEKINYSGRRNAYYDLAPDGWISLSNDDTRPEMDYDWKNMFSMTGEEYRLDGRDRLLLKGWLMRGAIREDDLPLEYLTKGPLPDRDPHGEIVRVYHHFYDPVNHAALLPQLVCAGLPDNIGKCYTSPDWAFGQADVTGPNPQGVDPNRRNHSSWADARNALWCALTRNEGLPHPLNLADRNAAERRLCWATTIKALGHALHLLQDTAQPQHARNDPHNPPGESYSSQVFGTSVARRAYEA